jgi:hypothetical protein
MADDRGKFEGRTYLYIRDHPLDTGAEPLPANLPCWGSPDVTIIRPDGTRGLEAIASQLNKVEVTVTNDGGLIAGNAYVDVFFADPTTIIIPATATLIGGGYLTIYGYSRQTISFPWIPPPSEVGHRCLLARVSLIIPSDTYRNGLIFDVAGDRHVTQRNINVMMLGPSGTRSKFVFHVVNIAAQATTVRAVAQEIRDPEQLKHIRTSLGSDFVRFGDTRLRTFELVVDGAPSGREVFARLAAGEVRDVILQVERNPRTRSGTLHAIHITQEDERRTVLGGLTVIVQH